MVQKKEKTKLNPSEKKSAIFPTFFFSFSLFSMVGGGGGGIDPYQEKKINKGKNKEKG